MDGQQHIRGLIQAFAGNANILAIPVCMIKYTGDFETAALLNQLIYWDSRTTNEEGWVYKTYQEWEDEICLKEREVRHAKTKLETLGVIETKLKKVNGAPTLHYRILWDALNTSFLSFLNLQNLKNGKCKNGRMETSNFEETLTNNTYKDYNQKLQNKNNGKNFGSKASVGKGQTTLVPMPSPDSSPKKLSKAEQATERVGQARKSRIWKDVRDQDFTYYYIVKHKEILGRDIPINPTSSSHITQFRQSISRYNVKRDQICTLVDKVLNWYKNSPQKDKNFEDLLTINALSTVPHVVEAIEQILKDLNPVQSKYNTQIAVNNESGEKIEVF